MAAGVLANGCELMEVEAELVGCLSCGKIISRCTRESTAAKKKQKKKKDKDWSGGWYRGMAGEGFEEGHAALPRLPFLLISSKRNTQTAEPKREFEVNSRCKPTGGAGGRVFSALFVVVSLCLSLSLQKKMK